MKVDTIEKLNQIKKESIDNLFNEAKGKITIGMATCGLASGAGDIFDVFKEKCNKYLVEKVGCLGSCFLEPIVEVFDEKYGRTTYVLVNEAKANAIIEKHILGGDIVSEYTVGAIVGEDVTSIDKASFFAKQTRTIMNRCGLIDPECIYDYIALDGYQALYKVVNSMSADEVINCLIDSGLRGRGGAGFPTGLKWKSALGDAPVKYVVCNADEGDPGAFMNRSILEGDPHSVIESMIIAAYTIGAKKGFIYCRAEYPLAVARLRKAIEDAYEFGLLGENIFNSDFSFDLEVRLGAGAFVCGEETALLESIEGKRGEPRLKPPFPTVSGLWGCPTVINNVNTYANVARIILNGADWFIKVGTEKSKGTKVFSVGGDIKYTGLVEVPMGTNLKTIIYEMAGGIVDDLPFKAAQTGGPSGGCIPSQYIDMPIDYDSLKEVGAMMGSGGLIIMSSKTCMVDVAKFFMDFTVNESCGKCVPCRIGTKRMWEILDRITKGEGEEADIEKLVTLGENIKNTAFCGLGGAAPNPTLSTIRYFKDEYLAHIKDKKCPAGVCKGLACLKIDEEKCVGCGMCAKVCPVGAIEKLDNGKYRIDQDKCTKCGLCFETCKLKAISK